MSLIEHPHPQRAAFIDRIRRMNEIFDIERNETPMYLGVDRLRKFRKTIRDELFELDDIVETALSNEHGPVTSEGEASLAVMVSLADFLGDVVVYAFSEARRWGIPIDQVLHAIMDSQDSKLVDGKALKDEHNKFLKGPDYKPPEPAIQKILEALLPSYVTVHADVPAPVLPPPVLTHVAQDKKTYRSSSQSPNETNISKQSSMIPKFRPLQDTGKFIYSGHLVDALVPTVQPGSSVADRERAAQIIQAELVAENKRVGEELRENVWAPSLRMTVPGEPGPRGIVFALQRA